MTASGTEASEQDAAGLRLDEPVVVLTGSRHGSTLVRLILDAHPSLACPAETNILSLSARLARAAELLANAGDPAFGPPPDIARQTIDALFGDHLRRVGKQRWCDKSIDTSRNAAEFLERYPKTKFLCLYRHCLDVIDSGIEVTPWGLSSFGFRPFGQRHPGNDVAAIAEYWLTMTSRTLEFEQAHPEICHRVYYEDLVGAPEDVAAEIFEFLGEPVVPGITTTCFAAAGASVGPGDPKVWATSAVSARSIGRGARVPLELIPVTLRGPVSELLVELGYPKLGDRYDQVGRSPSNGGAPAIPGDDVDQRIGAHLREALSMLPAVSATWRAALGGKPVAIVGAPWLDASSHWRVDLAGPSCVRSTGDPLDGTAWAVLAEPDALIDVMNGRLNLAIAMRRGLIRIERDNSSALSADVSRLVPLIRVGRDDVVRLQITARLLGAPSAEPDESWEQ